jgi:hypothetical protein
MYIVVRIIIVLFFSLQEDEKKKEPEEPEHSRKLFGGLSYQTINESLKACFEKWGDIMDVAVMKDPKTNKYVSVVIQINLMTVGSTCSQSWVKHNITSR